MRLRKNFSLLLSFLGIGLLVTSCSLGQPQTRSNSVGGSPDHQSAAASKASPTQTLASASSIRSVDFDNISYPNLPDYSDPRGYKKKRITLKPGEGGPSHLNYGDITGDGAEEAMAVLPIENRGSAIPYYVYIFTLKEGKPTLLWDFKTGDRADGGLRQVYADNGELVIELFGKDRVIGEELYRGDEGLCCASSFTRARYKWTGRRFQQIGKEIFPNPRGNASPIMPLYSPNDSPKR